jgi:hypothetical protein
MKLFNNPNDHYCENRVFPVRPELVEGPFMV